MQLVVISPAGEDPREVPALEAMIASGLYRYHVRKPGWSEDALGHWIRQLPGSWRERLVLHGNPALARELGLAGSHHRDDLEPACEGDVSRSCHDLEGLRRHAAAYPQVIFGPVFASISKPGRVPDPTLSWEELPSLLAGVGPCRVIAVGGITAARIGRCRELGFHGVAVIGAVWGCDRPEEAFLELKHAALEETGRQHAA